MGSANLNATKLSAQKGGKEFEAYIAKSGLQKVTWPTIVKENDFNCWSIARCKHQAISKMGF